MVAITNIRSHLLSHNLLQLIALQLAVSVFEDVYCADDVRAAYCSDHAESINAFILLLVNMTCSLNGPQLMDFKGTTNSSGSVNNDSSSNETAVTDTSDAVISQIDAEVCSAVNRDFAILAMELIGTALAVLSDAHATKQYVDKLKNTIVTKTKLLAYCSELIKDHHVSARVQRGRNYTDHPVGYDKSKKSTVTTDKNILEKEETVKNIVKSTLQLLGNVVYDCREAQVCASDDVDVCWLNFFYV